MEKKSLEVRDGVFERALGVASSSCVWAVVRTVACESGGIGLRNKTITAQFLISSATSKRQQLAHRVLRNTSTYVAAGELQVRYGNNTIRQLCGSDFLSLTLPVIVRESYSPPLTSDQ